MIFFFFSSRRRHTRFDCDWSSDVCSSDLIGDSLNEQNNLGLTLSGQSGSNLFKLSMVSNGSTTGAQWTGATTPTTTVVDSSQLKASDYQIVFGSTAPAGKVIQIGRASGRE